ncbi:hypothetical protein CNMCM7691_004214 [Aspergillus felis]|uniref:LITAF domain-containing protein n=1 Tax=Aspergillus felis TaxID=1287682 RepID=A0A8H6VAQ5_9EURO|nr:hypothetical protein CNMCM7691_004214 [Aspergillus felis]
MEAEKIISTPIPADEQHSTLEVHQPAPIAHQNTYMQPPTSLPQYPPQQQPLSQPPGQEYYHTGPGMGHPSGYNTATPLHSLKRGPTPVDCPVCGQRGMTRAEAQTGKTTQ